MTKQLKVLLLLLFSGTCIYAQSPADSSNFKISENGTPCSITIDSTENKVVQLAAQMLSDDIGRICGTKAPLKHQIRTIPEFGIIAGTIGRSRLINQLISSGIFNPDSVQHRWECFQIQHIHFGKKNFLLVAGSDRRGTAYGLLEISKRIGISPWIWWDDVSPLSRKTITLSLPQPIHQQPSVKYRGIFINDEDWGLQPWAAHTLEPETGNIGPATYQKVFALLLRLKANTIWPAMHSCTTPFYQIPENKQLADDYAIIIGTSHAEPMLSNINGEWDERTMGPYRYDTNGQSIRDFFTKRVKETSNYENIYSMGMRGKHDSPMRSSAKGIKAQNELLEQIISDERTILSTVLKKDARNVPQVLIPYKEVLTAYENGLQVPNDITLVWPDDNYGYIRHFPTPEERQRKGGSGVYYHTSYWGRPHDYLWLNTTHPQLIREEMEKAWRYGIRRLWILNCGDLKPAEYNISLFMDMAWNTPAYSRPESIHQHMTSWYALNFGATNANTFSRIMERYYELSFERRPEFMAWSQTEPTTPVRPTALNEQVNHDEIDQRLLNWQQLLKATDTLKTQIRDSDKAAFFELIEYPVKAAVLMNQKWLYYYKNKNAADQQQSITDWYAQKSKAAYANIQVLTHKYNQEPGNGKWQGIMSASPRHLPVFQLPVYATIKEAPVVPHIQIEQCAVPIPGQLPELNPLMNDSCFIDLYLSGIGNKSIHWQASANNSWVHLSQESGQLNPKDSTARKRIWLSLNKTNFEQQNLSFKDHYLETNIKINAGDSVFYVSLPVYCPDRTKLDATTRFIEYRREITINAANAGQVKNATGQYWQIIPGLGYSQQAIELISNPDSASTSDKSPAQLYYNFQTFHPGKVQICLRMIPTHPVQTDCRVRCSVAIDTEKARVLDFTTRGRSNEWKANVLANSSLRTVKFPWLPAGKHQLILTAVDPEIIIDQIRINLAPPVKSYYFPQESKINTNH